MHKIRPSDHNLLTESIVKFLTHNRIFTIMDFIQEDVEKLSALTKLTLPQVLAVRLDFINKYSSSLINGCTLYSQILSAKTHLSTGIESLDCILKGGIPTGCITEVCGLAGSGKSSLCLQLCINFVKDCGTSILYISTKGDFSPVKLQRLLQVHGYHHKEMALIMLRIKVAPIWTMDELIDLLMKIKKKDICIEDLKLIVIDSLPSLMFQYLGDDHKVDEDSTSAVKDHNIIERRNRGLGKYWQHIPALVLLLEMSLDLQDKNLRVTVIKSNSSVCNVSCSLSLGNLGII